MNSIFTKEELLGLKYEALVRLAKYYNVSYANKKKKDLVDELLSFVGSSVDLDEPSGTEGVPMSVRVRRILESNKNG